MAVVCNPIRMGRWSELMVVCVCHSDEVMREADANDTSGEPIREAINWRIRSVFPALQSYFQLCRPLDVS